MKIINLSIEKSRRNARVSATAVWEDSNREPVELVFETPGEFADRISVSANAFLVGALIPAMEAGEKRIAIEGEICPRLRAGLLTVIGLLHEWYGRKSETFTIEASAWMKGSTRQRPIRAGFFFSGGVDSLATLSRNRRFFPETHPDSFRDALILYGINFDSDDSPATFARAIDELAAVAKDARITLIPVYTNLRRSLNPDGKFFGSKFHGALLAATAHAFDRRLGTMSIASSSDIPNLMPWGSHPMLDPCYSSFDMRVYHDGVELSRFAKTRLVAEWNVALQNLKVCPVNWPGINCGKCEKCVRTRLMLAALGVLKKSTAFGCRDISEEEVHGIKMGINFFYYPNLLEPLRQAGRSDLARGVESVIAQERGENGWLGPLKRIDRIHFAGSFRTLKKNMQRSFNSNHGAAR